jgi:hypothetical protein
VGLKIGRFGFAICDFECERESEDFGKIAGVVEGNLPRSRRRVATGGLCSVYRDMIITIYGISVNTPSSVSVIEPGTIGPSATLLGPTVMVKVGRTALLFEFVIVKP